MSDEKAKFKAALGRLHMCGNRIFQAHFALERSKLDLLALDGLVKMKLDHDTLDKFQVEIIIKTNSLIERIIINIENIFEIHNEIKLFLEESYPELFQKLEVLWNEIFKIEDLTGRWRNNVTAHGKFMGKEHQVTLPGDFGSIQKNLHDIIYASVLMVKYSELILANVTEYKESWKELSEKKSQYEEDKNEGIDYNEYYKARQEAEKKLDSFLEDFEKNGFKSKIEYDD